LDSSEERFEADFCELREVFDGRRVCSESEYGKSTAACNLCEDFTTDDEGVSAVVEDNGCDMTVVATDVEVVIELFEGGGVIFDSIKKDSKERLRRFIRLDHFRSLFGDVDRTEVVTLSSLFPLGDGDLTRMST
jgi:hypothetical protein